ncbi:MAG: hypothetical protein ABWZ91_12250 [Nocardioides sp.]
MPMPRRSLTAALAAVTFLLGACTGEGEPAAEADPSAPSTPLASYAADTVVLDRGPFCEDIPAAAVEEALGGAATDTTAYGNGERARLTDDVRDVSHEFGCTFRSEDGTTARAWLFAPPVTPARARDLVRQARTAAGCQPQPNDPGFGQRSVAVVCDADGETTASYHGLFGDAWLSCSLAVPTGSVDEPALLDRTGRWCVQVAEAASA